MAAQIPIKDDPAANEAALNKVRNDKLREVKAGHDGTWVAHPALVPIAMEIFNANMPTPNQLNNLRLDVNVTAKDLLPYNVAGKITLNGIRGNISVGVQYIESWLRGVGCAPLFNLMEDAATAEISRSQLWQWLKHGAKTEDGQVITRDLINRLLNEEMAKLKSSLGAKYTSGKFDLAKERFIATLDLTKYEDFIPSLCYDDVVTVDPIRSTL